jgi:hypothetical protein
MTFGRDERRCQMERLGLLALAGGSILSGRTTPLLVRVTVGLAPVFHGPGVLDPLRARLRSV